jgi:predicted transcriptional regulator of viral defense system
MQTPPKSASALIQSKLYEYSHSGVVKARDLRHLAKESALHRALSRLCQSGTLRRLSKGVYQIEGAVDKAAPCANRMLEYCWGSTSTNEAGGAVVESD